MLRNTKRKIASAAASRSSCDHVSTSAKRAPAASSVVSTRPGRQLVDHVGNVDERMVGVPVGEQALIVGFDAVVELLDEPRAQLFDQRPGFEAREHQPERAEHDVGVDEIGADRFVDTGVLHLDRDVQARVRHRAVHLPDRRRRDRRRDPTARTRARARRRAARARSARSARVPSAARPVAAPRARRAPVAAGRRRDSSPSGRASSARPSARRARSRRRPRCAVWCAASSSARRSGDAVARRTRWTAWRVPGADADRGEPARCATRPSCARTRRGRARDRRAATTTATAPSAAGESQSSSRGARGDRSGRSVHLTDRSSSERSLR